MASETEIDIEMDIEKRRQIQRQGQRQRGCGGANNWCDTFVEFICCPCLLFTFILGNITKLIGKCVFYSKEKWHKLLDEKRKKDKEEKSDEKKTAINWLKTSYHIIFELYKVVISSFLIIFTQQKCIADDGSETTCTMYDNFHPTTMLEKAGLGINFVMFGIFILQYIVEITREHYLIKYLEYSSEIPNNGSNLEQFKNDNNIKMFNKLNNCYIMYMKISQLVLLMYLANIGVSAAVVYNNYLNKSSIVGFVTNSLFVFIKIGSVIEITSDGYNAYYSAYRKQHIHYNIMKTKYFEKFNINDNDNDNDNDVESSYYIDENNVELEIIDDPEIAMIETMSNDSE